METRVIRGVIKGVDVENKIVHATVSDESIDRHGEKVLAEAYKKRLSSYKKHPVLLSSHSYHGLTSQIGVAEDVYIEDNALHCKFKYFAGEGNSEADWGFKLAQKGVAAFSVGFIGHKYDDIPYEEYMAAGGKKARRCFTDVELLEISQVTVPANPKALQKGIDNETEDSFIKEMCITAKDLLEQEANTESSSTETVLSGEEEIATTASLVQEDKKELTDVEKEGKVEETLETKGVSEKIDKLAENLDYLISLVEEMGMEDDDNDEEKSEKVEDVEVKENAIKENYGEMIMKLNELTSKLNSAV